MSSSINIYPFSDSEGLVRYGIQVAIFLVGIYAAHKLIVKPALKLHAERKKRTEGSTSAAKADLEKANSLEKEYFSKLKAGADEVHKLRAQEISLAQQTAHSIINETQQKTDNYLKNILEKLNKETIEAKQKLLPQVEEIVKTVYQKLGIMILPLVLCGTIFTSTKVFSEEQPVIPSFWYSVFWPYFQFAIFVVAIVYFARKPIKEVLDKNRIDLRAKLSEAHEAVHLADKKVKEYESKVASLEYELRELKNRNLEEARLEKERIISEANKTAEILLREAQRTAVELINSSSENIKKELFALAIEEVEKRLTQDKIAVLDDKFKQEALDNIKNIHH